MESLYVFCWYFNYVLALYECTYRLYGLSYIPYAHLLCESFCFLLESCMWYLFVFFGTWNLHLRCTCANTAGMKSQRVRVPICKRTLDLYGCPYSLYAWIMCYCVLFFHYKVHVACMWVFFGTLNVHGTCMGAHTACMHQLCVTVFLFFTWSCVLVVCEYLLGL